MSRLTRWTLVAILMSLFWTASASAQPPQLFAPDATRYMALGDSIAAGYKAMPATNGYAFLLYQDGVFDRLPHTLFNDAAVPGMTSAQVLQFQVPQAIAPNGFNPEYVTLTVGGNDLLSILAFAESDPNPNDILAFAQQTIAAFGQNLGAILATLRTHLPGAKVFVSNQYTLPGIQAALPVTDQVVDAFNSVVAQVVGQFPTNVYLVDVHSAFLGRNNLIEGDHANISPLEVHPTNAGHRVIEKAFADVISLNR